MTKCFNNDRLVDFAKYMFRCGEEAFSQKKEVSSNKEIDDEVHFALEKFFEEVVLPSKAKELKEENKLN